MDQTAYAHVLLETVALGAYQDQEPAGFGRESEVSDPARCQQQELLAHGQNPGVTQQALNNTWLATQGLLSVKDLWCKAQGYTQNTPSSRMPTC